VKTPIKTGRKEEKKKRGIKKEAKTGCQKGRFFKFFHQ
jgi:hypothetical protein